MSSIEENQCIDPSLLVSEYSEELMSVSPDVSESVSPSGSQSTSQQVTDSQTYAPTHLRTYAQNICESPQAYTGAECTPDTYIEITSSEADKLGLQSSPLPLRERATAEGRGVRGELRADVPTVELSDFGPLAPVVAVVALVLGGLGASCGPSSGGGGNGDGGFRFGGDDGGGDDDMTMPVDDPDDVDGDGYPADKDCDDTDASIHPRATETPYDGIDQDCNGEDVIDADGDGFVAVEADGDDCNDDQAYIHPGAEQRLTGFDTNCDGSLEIDLDRDSVKFVGENDGDRLGTSMAMGDVNGDGYGDVLISAPVDNVLYDRAGRAYVFFGGPDRLLPGSTLNASEADVVFKGACGWGLGARAVKDLDGDGMAEILMGPSGYNNTDCDPPIDAGDHSRSGAIFVIKGRETWESSYDFYEIDAWDEGVLGDQQIGVIKGTDGLRLGGNILLTGDMDGDGVGQIVAGRGSQCDVIPARVYEGINRIDEVRDSEGGYHIHNSTGTPFNGNPCDYVASGDLNGDGLADLVLGDAADQLGLYDGAGRVSTLMGSESLPSDINLFSLETYSGLNYLQFSGNGPAYGAGGALAVGDLDADGKAELMIGVRGEDSPMEDSGRAYCIPGSAITEVIDGENPDFENGDTLVLNGDVYGLGGLAFYSSSANSNLPDSLAVVDTSNDGMGELLVGAAAYAGSPVRSGRVFYFGSSSFDGGAMDSEISVTSAMVDITSPDLFGGSIVGGGDPNGDGVQDVLVNALRAPDDTNRGTAYLLFGGSR